MVGFLYFRPFLSQLISEAPNFKEYHSPVLSLVKKLKPVPVAMLSKAWVCCRSPAEIVSLNPTGGMDVFLL